MLESQDYIEGFLVLLVSWIMLILILVPQIFVIAI